MRGLRPRLHYGVTRQQGEVKAHAWLEVGGLPVVGHAQAGDFSLLASFPAEAELEQSAAAVRSAVPNRRPSNPPGT